MFSSLAHSFAREPATINFFLAGRPATQHAQSQRENGFLSPNYIMDVSANERHGNNYLKERLAKNVTLQAQVMCSLGGARKQMKNIFCTWWVFRLLTELHPEQNLGRRRRPWNLDLPNHFFRPGQIRLNSDRMESLCLTHLLAIFPYQRLCNLKEKKGQKIIS